MTDVRIEPDTELSQVVTEFFGDLATRWAEKDPDVAAQWSAAATLGFTLVGVAEERGGSGGSLLDSLAVVQAASYHAIPLPLAETAVAAWLLAAAGQSVPAEPLSIAPGHAADTLEMSAGRASGVLHGVPWGRDVSRVVALLGSDVVVIDPSGCEVTPGYDLAGQPRDTLTLTDVAVESYSAPVGRDEFFWRAALIRTAQISGALAAVDQRTRQYTQERVQFGKPIAAFQSVQQHIVNIAQAAESSSMALWQAAAAVQRGNASFECCAGKLMADESARVGVRAAHQAHGAIGMTQEFPLHELTRRLNTWRLDFGTEAQLSEVLGRGVAEAPSFAHCIFDEESGVSLPCPI